jgi:hypothetical protein
MDSNGTQPDSPTGKPTFVLRLEAQHRADDPDGVRRLRGLLKVLLRSLGFRCIECKPDSTEGTR